MSSTPHSFRWINIFSKGDPKALQAYASVEYIFDASSQLLRKILSKRLRKYTAKLSPKNQKGFSLHIHRKTLNDSTLKTPGSQGAVLADPNPLTLARHI